MSIYKDILIKGIFNEIIKVRNAGAITATAIMVYVAIDTMAFLAVVRGKKKNDSVDFIDWVDKYLITESSQPYQYGGKDMWGARCALLHSYASNSEYADKNNCKIYGYVSGLNHFYNPEENKSLVLIGVDLLANDFGRALVSFLKNAANDPDLKSRIDSRVTKVCDQFDINY